MKSMFTTKLARFAAMCVGCAIVVTNIHPSFAQSTDRDNPTPLTVKLLSNPGRGNKNTVYYYSLTAKPGRMTITLDCDAGSDNDAFSTSVRIETLDGKNLQSISDVCSPGSPKRKVERIEFPSETPVVLLLRSDGHYRIKFDGDWTQSGSAATPPPVVTTPSVVETPRKKPKIRNTTPTKTPKISSPTPTTTDSTTSAPEIVTAVVRKEPELDYSEEQTLTVSCNSTGQVCDNSAVFNFRPSRNHSLIWLTAPSTHCSVVNYFVEDAQNPKSGISGTQLAPGKRSFVQVGLLAKGSTRQFRIRATGVKGGCNTGSLKSWSVKVRLGSGEL
jgi:hypothetical protein